MTQKTWKESRVRVAILFIGIVIGSLFPPGAPRPTTMGAAVESVLHIGFVVGVTLLVAEAAMRTMPFTPQKKED
jgi:hypothetical protein